jgi:hypothetical protein
MKNKRKHLGNMLLDYSIHMTILAVALAGVMVVAGTMRFEKQTAETISDISFVSSLVRSIYQETNSLDSYSSGSITEDLINTGRLPKRMVDSSGMYLKSPFGDTVMVSLVGTSFQIMLLNVPEKMCASLATNYFGEQMQFVRVIHSSTTTSTGGGPLTVSQATAACSVNSYSVGQMIWQFGY